MLDIIVNMDSEEVGIYTKRIERKWNLSNSKGARDEESSRYRLSRT